jgi:hypothetical protein
MEASSATIVGLCRHIMNVKASMHVALNRSSFWSFLKSCVYELS